MGLVEVTNTSNRHAYALYACADINKKLNAKNILTLAI